jgi:Fur family ferric uptake transcriptional regulator
MPIIFDKIRYSLYYCNTIAIINATKSQYKMKRRSTPTKEAVISVLSASTKAMSQDAIEKKIEIGIDRATIYRVLNQFCDDGTVHKIVADDGKQYFAICKKCDAQQLPDNHFHFRCTSCQTMECLPVAVDFSISETYKVERSNCVLIGTCRDCA